MKSEPELLEEALTKLRRGAPYSVAAVLVAAPEPRDADRLRWRAFVTDGEATGFVEAEPERAVEIRPETEIPATYVERAVEYAAGRLPPERRLQKLLAASPVAIPL